MDTLILLIIAVGAGALLSLAGGIYLLYGKWGAAALQRFAVPFAAGALLAAAFLDLLPEAMEGGDPHYISSIVLIGILLFFVLERGLSWFHHHHQHVEEGEHAARPRNSVLIIFGDTLHNFIDGLAIGAAFLVSPATGVITTLAIAAHEIPQEIGDFGLLLAKGMKRRRVVMVNILSAMATVVAAVAVYAVGGELPLSEPLLLAITAGFFIYIAASDIIPAIHAEPLRRAAAVQTIVLLAGVIFVAFTIYVAHDFLPHTPIDEPHSHEEAAHDDHDH